MVESFTRALARIHTDYEFYVGCQTDPDAALAGYDLTQDERSALTDPDRLAAILREDLRPRNIPSITVKISGRHDWVNRAPKKQQQAVQERVHHEVAAIKSAGSEGERAEAVLRLIERIG